MLYDKITDEIMVNVKEFLRLYPQIGPKMSVTGILSKFPVLNTFRSVWRGFCDMATTEKVPKVMKRIGTHSGVFHCDEALACFMLQQLPEYESAEIVRTRDLEVLKTCDIVVDVGDVYNHFEKRYDHHQKTFQDTFSTVLPHIAKDKTIRLSSAGLIYCHYGIEVITEILKRQHYTCTSDSLIKIFIYVYENFVEELDAMDNGVLMCEGGETRYKITTNLGSRVSRLNSPWNAINPEHPDILFRKAMALAGKEFTEHIIYAATVWWPGREIIQEAVQERKKLHPSGKVILLKTRCPWSNHLHAVEKEFGITGEITFVLFEDNGFRVQAVPIVPDSFQCRIFLHEDWRGLRDDALSKVSEIKDCIFCHASGFIGGNKTKEGALQMAIKSLSAFHN